MIVLLLNCLNSYAQTINGALPSTGEQNETDSSLVVIPINYIRLANQKLLERQYLLEVNQYKDSIIVDYKNYIKEQERINKNFQNKLKEVDKINNDLNKRLSKQKKTSIICGSVAGTAVLLLIITSTFN